jgi:hypothetical protein
MARPTIKFTIRFMMFLLLAACTAMAWIAHVRQTGIQQAKSIQFLNDNGCWIPPGQRLNTIPSPTQPGRYIQTRSYDPDPGAFRWNGCLAEIHILNILMW